MIFVIGSEGLIGSALVSCCAQQGLPCAAIDKHNYNQYIGQSCDLLINANGNPKARLAQERPLEDFELSVRSVYSSLVDFTCRQYVLLSSAHVYPHPVSPGTTREDTPIDPACQTPYGFHKYLAEQAVRHRARNWLILRLTFVLGPNLRRNGIFDILNGGKVWVHPDSEFQYLHTADLARIAFALAGEPRFRNTVVNVAGAGVVSLREAAEWAGVQLRWEPESVLARYELSLEKLSSFCTVPETRETVRRFIRDYAARRGAQT